jgi:hypothetical protein
VTFYEVGTIALVAVLAMLATAAIYVVRCAACHHLTFSSANQAQGSCAHCRHPALLHPMYTARHRGNPVRVVGDRLRY